MALHFGQGVALVYYPPSPTLPSQETFQITKRKLSEGRRASFTRTNKKTQPNPSSYFLIMAFVWCGVFPFFCKVRPTLPCSACNPVASAGEPTRMLDIAVVCKCFPGP
jgi:hypothetical protein